jgi:two-component system cell cycle response regulator
MVERDTLPGDEYQPVPPTEREVRKRPHLLVLSGPQFGDLVELEPGKELSIGRRASADVCLHDEGVSRRHASLVAADDHAVLRDLGSQNGTYVDGERVTERRLVDGQRFQLGAHTTLKFVCCDEVEADYQRRLAQGALLEPLTGLYNRRYFMERLAAELAAAQRHGRAVSLLLLDVDHFKRVNDQLGHAAGDEALRMLARVLLGAVRKEDVLARLGGEEFVVLARETTLSGAHALGERMRRAVERSRFSFDGTEVALTVSIGVTVSAGLTAFEPGRTEGELLEVADRALYRAKEHGRNAVVALAAAGERGR